jgi:hypothetical protein
MHADGDLRMDLDQGVDQAGEHDVVGVLAGAAARLDDHGGVDLGRRIHDGEALLHVVDVEGGHPVAVLGRVVEKLSKRDAGHVVSFRGSSRTSRMRGCRDL